VHYAPHGGGGVTARERAAAQGTAGHTAKKTMQITVRLLASYRRYLPDHHDDQAGYAHEITAGTTVADLLTQLPIPPADAYTFFLNGRHVDRSRVLAEGDVVSVFPAVGGGQ